MVPRKRPKLLWLRVWGLNSPLHWGHHRWESLLCLENLRKVGHLVLSGPRGQVAHKDALGGTAGVSVNRHLVDLFPRTLRGVLFEMGFRRECRLYLREQVSKQRHPNEDEKHTPPGNATWPASWAMISITYDLYKNSPNGEKIHEFKVLDLSVKTTLNSPCRSANKTMRTAALRDSGNAK